MGYIYILSNKYYKHGKLLKIGMTSRTVDRRVKELNGAFGVPDYFLVVFKKQVKLPNVAEREIHKRLSSYRVNKNREFFLVDKNNAVRVVGDVCALINKTSDHSHLSATGRTWILALLLLLYLL